MKHYMDISANERTMLWSHSDKDIRYTTISKESQRMASSWRNSLLALKIRL